ncbi:MAG: hypothetical protein ACOC8H_00710 [bacterium]
MRLKGLITGEIPGKVAADTAYQTAKKQGQQQNAGVEYDDALKRVIISLVQNVTDLFKQWSENESFCRCVADTISGLTYEEDAA